MVARMPSNAVTMVFWICPRACRVATTTGVTTAPDPFETRRPD
jgi:hypothetical protein